MSTRVLILGGTAEARELAAALAPRPDVMIISSLAGRVSDPRLPVGAVRIGGFGGPAGLARWLAEQRITAVIDATHPYAARIRTAAVVAAAEVGAAHLRLERPGWIAQPGDRWHRVAGYAEAAALLPRLGRRIFLTTGRQHLAAFTGRTELSFLARFVDPPDEPVPANVRVLLARGPYDAAREAELLRQHRIEVLVTKDSGGLLTVGKLTAARELSLPVVMIDRPSPVPAGRPVAVVPDVAGALDWLARSGQPAGTAGPPTGTAGPPAGTAGPSAG
jgi:precorrin-6A/cobalt-precorrin-6A reductase